MSALAQEQEPRLRRRALIPHAALKRGALWLLTASSWIAIVEPSPYEIAFLLMLFVFVMTGIRFSAKLLPLAALLLLFNLGGAFSLIPWMHEPDSVRFIAVSFYMMVTAVVLAAIVTEDTQARIEMLKRGYLVATWCAGLFAIIGYFDIAGLGESFTLYGRASGTFKDPNVLGPFLVLPIVFVLQEMLVGRRSLPGGIALISVPLAALFLTFSRGAWGVLVASTLLMIALSFLTAPNGRMRGRIVALSLATLFVAVAALMIALSFEGIREVFEVRASLDQSYDQGATGRFGSQLRSIPLLLDEPNGFGPLRFRWLFLQQDPHNVYVNAFASYGWLGGVSWLALTAATCWAGWWLVFQRSGHQHAAIAVWSVLFVTILQGLQIDTDHWRHFYLMLGLTWGMAVAAKEPARDGAP